MADWNEFKTQEFRKNEAHLAKTIEKNVLLMNKLEEAQDEIERSHEQITAQKIIIDEYKQKIKKLEEKIYAEVINKNSFVNANANYERSSSRGKSSDDQERNIEGLLNNLRNKDRVIETLTSNQIFSQEKLDELKGELDAKNVELEVLKKRLKNTEKSIDTLFLNHKTEGEFVSELEHLRLDNQRLLDLLSKSNEFKILGQFIEDSGGAHYVPPSKSLPDETYNWVPSQLNRAIETYKQAPEPNDEVLNTLLLEINKSFRDREKAQISKLKSEYKLKISDLKRQLLMRQPYDTVKTKRQVTRLKTELKKANDEISVISSKRPDVIPKMQDLEETFKVLGDLKSQNAKLIKENFELKKNKANKSQFIEGVGWLGEKVMKEKSQMHSLITNILNKFEFDGTVSKENQEWLMVMSI